MLRSEPSPADFIEKGIALNQAKASEGVVLRTRKSAHLYWGLDAQRRCVAIVFDGTSGEEIES